MSDSLIASVGNKNEELKAKLRKFGIVFVLVGMLMLLGVFRPRAFYNLRNLFNVLQQAAIYGIMALGITFVIISKGIDLSIGSLLAFSGVVMASLGQAAEAPNKYFENLGVLPVFIPILVAPLIGMLLGAVNGFFISKTKIPPFIATLGMMTIARGFALIYTKGQPISKLQSGITILGERIWGFLPMPVLIYFLMIFISWVLLNHTRFGKNIYAIGGNIHAAEVSGVNVDKNLIMIYGYCGLMAGVAAVVFGGRVASVHPGAATGYELTAIAATTIGGTSHAGGIGTIFGAVMGAIVLSVLRNGLTLLGVDAYWQQVLEGAIIIGAVIVDMRAHRS